MYDNELKTKENNAVPVYEINIFIIIPDISLRCEFTVDKLIFPCWKTV